MNYKTFFRILFEEICNIIIKISVSIAVVWGLTLLSVALSNIGFDSFILILIGMIIVLTIISSVRERWRKYVEDHELEWTRAIRVKIAALDLAVFENDGEFTDVTELTFEEIKKDIEHLTNKALKDTLYSDLEKIRIHSEVAATEEDSVEF